MKTRKTFNKSLLTKTISVLLGTSVMMPTFAQEVAADNEVETITVTGIRGSLLRGMDLKRHEKGVVDAISSEDIGKFPATNLAESLQRIPGVSIDRVNGEGSKITVRGFGPDFNQVTLNGRTMPTADVPIVGSGSSGRASGAAGRAFDFSNLSSDGVQALEVFKTGRADISSGGIGATVNVATRRPLASTGLEGSFSAKAINDTSVDTGSSITPEFGGTLSWANEDKTFGIGFFGGISQRDNAAPGAYSSSWNVIPYSEFLGLTTDATKITNAPTDLDQFVTLPRDSRYEFAEFERERANGQLVMQFAPSEELTLTADYTFAVNKGTEEKSQFYNWFNRPFTEVVFDDSPVPSAVYLKENAKNKGGGQTQILRATKDELNSFGFNAEYLVNDSLALTFDVHSSTAEVTPYAPMGFTEINTGLDHKYGNSSTDSVTQSVDYSGDIPVRTVETHSGATVMQPERVASQVANGMRTIIQKNEIDQYDFSADWELDDGANLKVGANYRSQTNVADRTNYQQILGNWGAEFPGDVEALAPGVLKTFCISCRFEDHTIGGGTTTVGGETNNEVYAIRGNAADIFAALSPAYEAGYSGTSPRPLRVTSSALDEIKEDVTSVYAQLNTEFEIGGLDAYLNVGIRYERTDVTATTESAPTSAIIWQGNNDFASASASSGSGFSSTASYSNLLPNIDLAIDLTDEIKARVSYSKTMARATYNNLFASDQAGTPSGPTALGNVVTGSKGNPGLLPLESDNFDISLEWYFDEASYFSAGLFSKRVSNFVGRETVSGNLFGLRDVTSGAPGTRSGTALDIIDTLGIERNEDNLFAASVYVDQLGNMEDAMAMLAANLDGNTVSETEYDRLETNFELTANSDDPLVDFSLNQPVNTEDAKINGMEVQGQHFFGETGFGVVGSYTIVNGDVEFDVAGAPNVTQFALQGLSDTANLTLIYEKHGWSSRIAYNWRDEFLTASNDGSGFNNPVFVEAYGQLDINLSYSFSDNLSLSLDAINLNEERSRSFARSKTDLHFLRENSARYIFGVRYKF